MDTKQTQWINSKAYAELLSLGEDKGVNPYTLVGTYAKLLFHRNAIHFYKVIKNEKNNKITKEYRLLAKCTGLSLTLLKKYVPILIEEGLCNFMKSGGFFMLGAKTVTKKYNRDKRVCITVSGSITDIKASVMSVKLISNIMKSQPKAIEKKKSLSKTKRLLLSGERITNKSLRSLVSADKAGYDFSKVQRNTILSVKGVKRIIDEGSGKSCNGSYWKKKLIDNDVLVFRRRFKSIWGKKMTYKQFLLCRDVLKETYGHVTFKNGRVCQEVPSEVMVKHNYSKHEKFPYNTKYMLEINTTINNNDSTSYRIASHSNQ